MIETPYNYNRREEIKLIKDIIDEKEVMVEELREKEATGDGTRSGRLWAIELINEIKTLQKIRANCQYRLNRNIKKQRRFEKFVDISQATGILLFIICFGFAPPILIMLVASGII